MTATMYSAEDVADLLGLHVRTVRGYVRDGRLPAVRIGKQYRISDRDLREFTGHDSEPAAPLRIESTAIVAIDGVTRELTDRITNLVVAAANSNPSVHVQTVYNATEDRLKVIADGKPDETAEILTMINALVMDAVR